jgi:GntR family transcriptional regulator
MDRGTQQPLTALRRDTGAPLHHQISAVLRSAIASGRYGPGDYLPGENVLKQMYGVSRATVGRALDTLEDEGQIERRPGKGTAVLDVPFTVPMEQHLPTIERAGRDTTVSFLEWNSVVSPREVARALALGYGSRSVMIVRLRGDRDGNPLRHISSFVPAHIGGHLSRDSLQHRSLLSALADHGYHVDRVEGEVGATLADPILAAALDIRVGDPLLEICQIVFDEHRNPLAFQRTLIPPHRYKLRILVEGQHAKGSLLDGGPLAPTDDPQSAETTKGDEDD